MSKFARKINCDKSGPKRRETTWYYILFRVMNRARGKFEKAIMILTGK